MPEIVAPPEQPPVLPQPQETKSKKPVVVILLVIIFIVIGILGLLFMNNKNKSTIVQEKASNPTPKASPTPMPFADMTVPYLRNRLYASKLGDLEQVSQSGSYASYLTNYESDGYKIYGLLTIPTGDAPTGGWPAIVFVHGYIPPAQYRTLERYGDYVDYLARNGFVVFKIDLRGHGDSEGESGGGYFGSDYVVDTLNARVALASSDFVNPQKIGLWGHSMAGNVLLRSLAAKPDIPAIVVWGGAVYTYLDREKYGINDASFAPSQITAQRQSRRRELFEKYGSPSATSIFWQQVIPTNYLGDLKGAVSLHHAVDDDVVDVGYSRDLTILLEQASVPHELFEYQYGGHNISGSSFVQAMERTVAFYKRYL